MADETKSTVENSDGNSGCASVNGPTAISWTTIRGIGVIVTICGLAFREDGIAITGTTLLGASAVAELIKDKWGKP